jgi:precorrin-6B methylase 2
MRFIASVILALISCVALGDESEWRPPFITTPPEVVERMLEMAQTHPDDLVIDLGSGDGRIVIAAAQKFGARGLGIELDAALVEKSRESARLAQLSERVKFVQGDVLAADISQATVVTAYLLPALMVKLQSRFIDELAPGTRIVSHAFTMAGWAPDRSETVKLSGRHPGQGDESRLHLWVVPADVRGVWRGGGLQLRIEQNYQRIEVEGASRATLS